MRRIITAALTLVAASSVFLGTGGTANANDTAGGGYNSSYAGESVFTTMPAGAAGQFSAIFFNSGTQTWSPGVVGLLICDATKVNCNVLSPNAAYASGWFSSTVYATVSGTVSPGQNGFFVYNFTVPAGTPAGTTAIFAGDVGLIATGAELHPEGYFQSNMSSGPTASAPRVGAVQSSVAQGAQLTIDWANIANPSDQTHVTLVLPGAAVAPVWSLPQQASGEIQITIPLSMPPGQYQLYLVSSANVSLATGGTITVTAAAPVATPTPTPTAPTATLSITPSSVPSTGGSAVLRFSSSNASSCTLASAPAFWPGANPASVNCNGTYSATLSPSTTAQQWAFTFTAMSPSGQSAAATQTLTELAPLKPTWATSPNWSGYVVPSSSSLITVVSGAWTVPTVNCAATPNGDAFIWVGIGGYGWPTGGTSGTLLQTGVRMNCVGGVPQYGGWFEEYPSIPNFSQAFLGFPVSPGDSIAASVFQAGNGSWATRVDDLTIGLSGVMVTGDGWGVSVDGGNGTFLKQGSTASLSYAGGYTAEWIVEDPGQPGSPVPFANYGTVTFTNVRTSLASWSLTASEGIAISQNGVVLSTPSLPASNGFSVSYTR